MNKQEGDGWAALERVRTDVAKMQANHEKQADDAKASNMTPHSERYIRGCADAEGDVLDAIDRELAARPAKEPIAETERHMAALCDETVSDEDAEVAEWELDAKRCSFDYPNPAQSMPARIGGRYETFLVQRHEIDAAVRIMRERGAAVKQMEKERDWERHWWPLRIAKSLSMTEEEMGRTPSMAEMAVLRMRTDLIARAEKAEAKLAAIAEAAAESDRIDGYIVTGDRDLASWIKVRSESARRKIHRKEAPGKAEAELARLQALVADVAKDMAKAIALMEATK